jgi:tetratricopeptide (TPR) repeat protein
MTKFAERTESMDAISRFRLAIEELDLAMADKTWSSKDVLHMQFDKAATEISLGRAFIEAGDLQLAGQAFQQSADIYEKLAASLDDSPNSHLSLVEVSAGLIRCGKPLNALKILARLSANDDDGLYLRGEAMMVMGDRENAAALYEKWISTGCSSHLAFLADDEFGKRWSFLLNMKPKDQTKCEQLPQELRSRLETLRTQFGHPNNLPVRSFPSVPILAVTDH